MGGIGFGESKESSWGWKCGSVVGSLPSVHEVVSSIPTIRKGGGRGERESPAGLLRKEVGWVSKGFLGGVRKKKLLSIVLDWQVGLACVGGSLLVTAVCCPHSGWDWGRTSGEGHRWA